MSKIMTKTISKDKFIGTFQEFIEHNLVSEGDELECVEYYFANNGSNPIFTIGEMYPVGIGSHGNLRIKDNVQSSGETIAKFRFKPEFDDAELLESFKSLMMQTRSEIRNELIGNVFDDNQKEILKKWVNKSCGNYSYQVNPK
jgi:hypothetical protein